MSDQPLRSFKAKQCIQPRVCFMDTAQVLCWQGIKERRKHLNEVKRQDLE